ncbi:sensor histidine kinase [Thalassovita aquimarina]|uniref:histidine kinase n=1 Tax=Thalassovita aquimarina TaxID=2785917 RepID=A0ABS5HX79_9RHOB|nr:HAMP domain-containing sensor histidine kinase [Thalassovita aquimarina]MBR9653562.1 HAMP domain-containing histidine kinase [Thalassovita aquimarina]
MTLSEATQPIMNAFPASDRLLQNLKDYTAMSTELLWQRQLIFLSASVLTGFYFSPIAAALFYGTIMLCEVQDLILARRAKRLSSEDGKAIFVTLVWILLNTLLSASAICVYAVSVALMQDAGGHFTPLFFLFAAALFAAMNNHQIVLALALRLILYGISFIFITIWDLWHERPGLESELWLHFFTVVFVMYFLIDSSAAYLRLYRRNLAQLETLREEHERTKIAYIAKSQFISTVSHELRTPLTSVKGSLDLINSGALGAVPEKMHGLMEIAGKNAQRLATLINDVLDLQKIEAGEMEYRISVVNAQALVFEAVESTIGYADLHEVHLECANENAEPFFVEADESRLMQVMANLISNAAKFSFNGGTVTVGCKRMGGKVRIYVKDEGIGIPEGVKDRVFERFTQLDSSDQRHAGGTGLGLNITKEIVEHFGGTIDYESEVGEGTTFFVDLPEKFVDPIP